MHPPARALVVPLLVAAMGVLAPRAWADAVAPTRADRAVLVSTAAGPQVFHLLKGGDSLAFAVTGPRKLDVVARRRLPAADITPPPVPLTILGDGQSFLTMQVGQAHDPAAKVRDGGGGATSGPDIARVEVPEKGLELRVKSAPGAPDLFVRVDARVE